MVLGETARLPELAVRVLALMFGAMVMPDAFWVDQDSVLEDPAVMEEGEAEKELIVEVMTAEPPPPPPPLAGALTVTVVWAVVVPR